jgi:serine/threonine protein phosphatase PrpC
MPINAVRWPWFFSLASSDRSPANPNSIHYRSSDSEEEEGEVDPLSRVQDDEATRTTHDSGHQSQASTAGASIASSLLLRSQHEASETSTAASVSSVKTSVKTAASPAARDPPVGTHSPSEVAAITCAITESFLAVDEGWINSIDPVATHQTSCQSNGRWNSGSCALVVCTVQRLEWTSVSEADREREMRGPEKCRGHDTSQNKDAAQRRMLDYADRAKSASSISTISSTSSLTNTEDRVNASGLESEITETEGEDDDHSTDDKIPTRRNPSGSETRARCVPKESLISAPGGCSCHCYRALDALLYTAHVGDCRAVMLGSAPPRTIKVHGSSAGHPDATDDESSHHSSDETECLSSSDHDADSSDDEDVEMDAKTTAATTSATNSSYMPCTRRPARRQSRRHEIDDPGMNAPFNALPPLEGFQSVEIEIDSDGDLKGRRSHSGRNNSEYSSSSSDSSHDIPPAIHLPPVTRPIDLTTDHSAYNPAEVTSVLRRCNNDPRAISAGVGGGIKRVAGSLAVTRALGDAYLKTPLLSFFPYKRHAPYITARPEVNCRPIVKDGDKVLILATDGVWERASGEDALRWVRNFYAERVADAERRKNRCLNPSINQSDLCSNDGSVTGKDDDRHDSYVVGSKRQNPRSSSRSNKRRKIGLRRSSGAFGSHRSSTVADVIVRRVLNKVRRARTISSLHALMSLPPGRARRSKHDDITASVVDLSAFVS